MEFSGKCKYLVYISGTWDVLWFLLNLTQVHITQLLRCRYQDWQVGFHHTTGNQSLPGETAPLTPAARVIVTQRQRRCQGDVFLFQSHSLRVQATARPVTVIDFNMALKKATLGVTLKNRQQQKRVIPGTAQLITAGSRQRICTSAPF